MRSRLVHRLEHCGSEGKKDLYTSHWETRLDRSQKGAVLIVDANMYPKTAIATLDGGVSCYFDVRRTHTFDEAG